MLQLSDLITGKLPKLCVSLASKSLAALRADAARAKDMGIDMAELRADYFDGDPIEAVKVLRAALGGTPVLFTLRTDGRPRTRKDNAYRDINLGAITSGAVDLIDIEYSCGEPLCATLSEAAKSQDILPVISHHDFSATPPEDIMLEKLIAMREFGIPKLAVTAQENTDTLALLSATEHFRRLHPECAAITVSMGEAGRISRVAGGFFGSAVTFASLDTATAPGQFPADVLRGILQALYHLK